MIILEVVEHDAAEAAAPVWHRIADAVGALGLTESVCAEAVSAIRSYGDRREREARRGGYEAALALALEDCRATLEGLLERLHETSGGTRRGTGATE
jgi:hypothetical protein